MDSRTDQRRKWHYAARNLIDLVNNSKTAQLRAEDRKARDYIQGEALIVPESLRLGLQALSKSRVFDTLIAESQTYSQYIENFRDSYSEHNRHSLKDVLKLEGAQLDSVIKELVDLARLSPNGTHERARALA